VEDHAYLGGAIAGLAFLVAGFRLFRLSVRTGEAPERLLGLTFLVWSLSYLSWQVPIAVETGWFETPLLLAGRVTEDIGSVTFALFLRVVFRPQERWATWLVVAVVFCMTAGLGSSFWVGDWESTRPLSNLWWWFEAVAIAVVFAWTGVEGFIQHHKARQRRRLGLCEPMICNRYLLWGLTGTVWVVYESAAVVQQIEYEITQVWSTSMDAVVGGLELAAIALIWLVFFPPAVYQRWVQGAAVSMAAEQG
jgi:hypothetical protein